MDAYLASRDLAWHPSEAEGQHYPDDMRHCLAEARRKFFDSPIIAIALRNYEQEVAELLVD